MRVILFILIIFFWLEITLTSLPLFLIGCLIMLIVKRQTVVFFLAFLGGLIIDAGYVRDMGVTSLFLVSCLFLILLYQRKYEIDTIPFVFASSFFGTFLYLWFFGYGDILIQSITGSIIAVLLFRILSVRSAHKNFQFSIFNFQ